MPAVPDEFDIADRSTSTRNFVERAHRVKKNWLRIGEYLLFVFIGIVATLLARIYRHKAIYHAIEAAVETRMDEYLQSSPKPIDLVLLLDASYEVSSKGWELQIEFSRRLIAALDELQLEHGFRLRVGLGQISSPAVMDAHLNEDTTQLLRSLRTWQCSQEHDSACTNHSSRYECIANPSCIARRRGLRDIGSALCGDASVKDRTLAFCKEGAMGEFLVDGVPENLDEQKQPAREVSVAEEASPAPRALRNIRSWRVGWWWPAFRKAPRRTIRPRHGALSQRLPTTSRAPSQSEYETRTTHQPSVVEHHNDRRTKTILMVSGGRPFSAACKTSLPTSEYHDGDTVQGAKDAVAAARLMKASWWKTSGSPSVFNILVGSNYRQDVSSFQALSSCCHWDAMEQIGEKCLCKESVGANCPFYSYRKSFDELMESATTLANDILKWSSINSVAKGEAQYRIERIIERTSPTKQFLWFLLPILPCFLLSGRHVVAHFTHSRKPQGVDAQPASSSVSEDHEPDAHRTEGEVQEDANVASLSLHPTHDIGATELVPSSKESRSRAATEPAISCKAVFATSPSQNRRSFGYTGKKWPLVQPTYLWGGRVLVPQEPQTTNLSFDSPETRDSSSQVSQLSFERKSWIFLDGRLSSHDECSFEGSRHMNSEIHVVELGRWQSNAVILCFFALLPAACCLSGVLDFALIKPQALLDELLL